MDVSHTFVSISFTEKFDFESIVKLADSDVFIEGVEVVLSLLSKEPIRIKSGNCADLRTIEFEVLSGRTNSSLVGCSIPTPEFFFHQVSRDSSSMKRWGRIGRDHIHESNSNLRNPKGEEWAFPYGPSKLRPSSRDELEYILKYDENVAVLEEVTSGSIKDNHELSAQRSNADDLRSGVALLQVRVCRESSVKEDWATRRNL